MIDQHIQLVKSQIAWLSSQIDRFSPGHPRYRPEQIALYERLASQHQELLKFLEDLTSQGEPSGDRAAFLGVVRDQNDDLSDLPKELLAELSDKTTRGSVDPIAQVIADRGGTATLDEILIDLYRKHGQVSKRTLLANKLYRLSRQGVVWSLPGKKGVYTTSDPDQSSR
jgi:hypothetical protein